MSGRYVRILCVSLAVMCVSSMGVGGSMSGNESSASDGKEITTSSGLQYIDQIVGTGETAKAGQTVSVHYTG